MKRLSSVLWAAAMMVGTFAATGCSKPAAQVAEPQQTESAAAASEGTTAATAATPATNEGLKVSATAAVQIPAPPALRTENPGRAPSSRHVFQRGYWRYESPRTGYVWVPGHWEERDVYAPTAPPPPRFEDPGRGPGVSYVYVPGYWRYDGREYVWVAGHWSLRADVGSYYRAEYVYVNGRWVRTVDRWDAARWAAHERAEREARERAERAWRERAEREARERAEREARERAEEQAKGSGSHDKPKPKEEEKAGAKNTRTSAPPISKVASAETKKETKPTPPRPVLLLPKKPAPRGRG